MLLVAKRKPPRVFDGERLKSLRNEKGVTLTALAEAIGMSAADLSRYENGKHTPSFDVAAAIAAALGVKLDELNKGG